MTPSPWTDEDRALLLAYRMYLDSLCSGGCGQPKRLAHHPDNEGWYDADEDNGVVCHACTALQKAGHRDSKEPVKPVTFFGLLHDRDYETNPLPPLRVDDHL